MKLGKLLELIELAKSGKRIVRMTEHTQYGTLGTYEDYKFEEVNLLDMDIDEVVSMKDETRHEQVATDYFEKRGSKWVYTYGTYDEMKKLAKQYGEEIIHV